MTLSVEQDMAIVNHAGHMRALSGQLTRISNLHPNAISEDLREIARGMKTVLDLSVTDLLLKTRN
jgi:hypothetical protein